MRTQKIILGTVQFGLDYGINNQFGKPKEEEVYRILDLAYSNGIRKLDTAFAYGNAQDIIGNYHKSKKYKYNIDTKFEINKGISISDQLEIAINKLNVPQIAVFYFHSFDDFVKYPDSLKELKILKREGKIVSIGVSVYDNLQLQIAIDSEQIDVIQLPFNLLDNMKKRGSLIRLAKGKGKKVVVRSVFLQGLFFKEMTAFPIVLEPLKNYLSDLKNIASENGMDMEQLALSYVSSQNEIDGVVIGVDNINQLSSNISQFNYILKDELKSRIDLIDVKETELLYPYNWK